MDTVVIIGAGSIGSFVATLLSKQEYNVILVDKDRKKLEQAVWNLDVATRVGVGTDWQLLEDLLEYSPTLLIALTSDDETNIIACSIAKQLGFKRTIARVKEAKYLNRTRLDFSHLFDIDHFIGPEFLVASEIYKYILSPGSIAVENFMQGAVQMRTLQVPDSWKKQKTPLSSLDLPEGIMVGLILRGQKVIFPHGEDVILPYDQVTFIGKLEAILKIHEFLGLSQFISNSIVVVGGSLIGVHLSKMLESQEIGVRLLEEDYDVCVSLSETLSQTTIINHNPLDLDFLIAEKMGESRLFVSCSKNDEFNIMSALLGKEAGCQDVLAVISNPSYIPMVYRLGINHSVSMRLLVSDHILSQMFAGRVSSLISLYENKAEVMEITVSQEAKVVGIPLSELLPLLPNEVLIALIQNRGKIMVAKGNTVISPGDTVILITDPKHVQEFENIF
jgi:trk system potassium uptake protein TrkA